MSRNRMLDISEWWFGFLQRLYRCELGDALRHTPTRLVLSTEHFRQIGEAAGIRMALVNSMSVAAPLVLGAIGASVGIVPVFWSVGACLATGGVLARRAGL